MNQGTLYTISAASGTGKSTLVTALINSIDNLKLSVSHTTRIARTGEIEGVHYHFVSKTEFQQILEADVFVEYATVFDNNYGTSKQWLSEQLNEGIDVILEIDWQGAQKVRQFQPNLVSIFVLPPSFEILETRLRDRKTDSEEVILNRLRGAREDISHYIEYDYIVLNDDFSQALEDLRSIIHSQTLKRRGAKPHIQTVLKDLLSTGV